MAHGKPLKICELFSPPRVTAKLEQNDRFVTTTPPNFDLSTGWDFQSFSCRKQFWQMMKEQSPDVVGMSPVCKPFSVMMSSNWNKMDPEEVLRIQTLGLCMMHFCVQVAEYQLAHGRYFYLEQPGEASSWDLNSITWLRKQRDVLLILFDQCAAGLSVAAGTLSRKSTGVISNHPGIIAELSKLQCDGEHPHLQLEGGLPLKAQEYPPGLVKAIIAGMQNSRSFENITLASGFEDFEADEAWEEAEPDDDPRSSSTQLPAPQTPGPVLKKSEENITAHQKELLHRLHANTGHAPREQMLMMLKAAGAKESVLKYTQHQFHCGQCMRQKRPVTHKQVAFPRTFSFNHIIGVDFFYISFQDKTHAFLNVVCQGTNFQQVGWLRNYEGGAPNSKDAWLLFESLWLRPFGLPAVLISDQGSEFKGYFERRLEQYGVLQVVCDAAAPWQNGRCERHGSWAKQRVEDDLQSGQASIESSAELEDLMTMMVNFKNKYFHRGGYSPYQLVFGINPRLPADLLSDDHMLVPALEDLKCDPLNMDSSAAEFARSHMIREKARQLCVKSTLKDKAQLGMRKYAHKERTWTPGQWVYVWRKFSGTGGGHATRARWVGPGLVVQQYNHSVWVAMRSRVWKCSSDQLRPANDAESLGAEMLDSGELQAIPQNTKSKRASAIDVGAEGPPPPEAFDQQPLSIESPEVHSILSPHRLATIPEEEQSAEQPSGTQPSSDVERAVGTGSLLRRLPEHLPHQTPSHNDSRRTSIQTIEEPLIEPSPTTAAAARDTTEILDHDPPSTERPGTDKRRKSTITSVQASSPSGLPVKKRVAEIEQEKLEREALKYLRQMKREERANRPSNPLASIPASSSAPPEAIPEPIQTEDSTKPEGEDSLSSLVLDGLQCFCFVTTSDGMNLAVKPVKAKNSEFDMKRATPEERKGFAEADKTEWESILGMKAVRLLSPDECKQVKRDFPHRIISSRMIRRKKPMPGLGAFKFQSRWCLHGHQDPDTGTFEVFSPMPSAEAITMFFQICLNENLKLSFLDVKNAFCQSRPLSRPNGKIYASPCEGTGLDTSQLLEIVVPVYGLDDAPLAWHQTLLDFFLELGFTRTLLEPCWLVKRGPNGEILAQVLIEVDDLNFGLTPGYEAELQAALEARFTFGKWEINEADFAGRHVKADSDKIIMHQEKYILEKIHPHRLPRGSLGDKSSRLSTEDFEAFRSLLYKVNWVAHQTRPEASGVVSLLASRLSQATVHDLNCLNKLATYLRSTARQPLTLHKFDSKKMVFVAASDAGGIDGKPISDDSQDTTQGAWIIMATNAMPSASYKVKAPVLSWRSAKLRRRVSSTLAGEALAFSQALGELEWLQIMFRDVVFGDVSRHNWQESILPFVAVLRKDCELHDRLEQCTVTDAKSLYDSLKKNAPTSRQDRRTSVEVAIIIEEMQRSKSCLRWSPHPRMVADTLTKDDISKGNGALEELLRSSRFALWDEDDELARRKTDPAAKGRFVGCVTMELIQYRFQFFRPIVLLLPISMISFSKTKPGAGHSQSGQGACPMGGGLAHLRLRRAGEAWLPELLMKTQEAPHPGRPAIFQRCFTCFISFQVCEFSQCFHPTNSDGRRAVSSDTKGLRHLFFTP
eukprot:s1227_g7.t1